MTVLGTCITCRNQQRGHVEFSSAGGPNKEYGICSRDQNLGPEKQRKSKFSAEKEAAEDSAENHIWSLQVSVVLLDLRFFQLVLMKLHVFVKVWLEKESLWLPAQHGEKPSYKNLQQSQEPGTGLSWKSSQINYLIFNQIFKNVNIFDTFKFMTQTLKSFRKLTDLIFSLRKETGRSCSWNVSDLWNWNFKN